MGKGAWVPFKRRKHRVYYYPNERLPWHQGQPIQSRPLENLLYRHKFVKADSSTNEVFKLVFLRSSSARNKKRKASFLRKERPFRASIFSVACRFSSGGRTVFSTALWGDNSMAQSEDKGEFEWTMGSVARFTSVNIRSFISDSYLRTSCLVWVYLRYMWTVHGVEGNSKAADA